MVEPPAVAVAHPATGSQPRGLGSWRLGRADVALQEARAASAGQSLDLSTLTDCDSAAVAILIALRRERGDSLRMHAPPARLRALADLYGVGSLLFDQDL